MSAVLAHDDNGIPYDRLVNIIAASIEPDRARHYRLSRLKRNPSETAAETLWKGQKAIARKYIDAANRAGRIEYHQRINGFARLVKLGRPATTSGTHAKERTWDQERDALSDTE